MLADDWDADGEQLTRNIAHVLGEAMRDARNRREPSLDLPREWQRRIMKGLAPTPPATKDWIGKYRGEEGQTDVHVRVALEYGADPQDVAERLEEFISELKQRMAEVEGVDGRLNAQEFTRLVAWTHNEWVRIHPFANGNGRTARIWANYIFTYFKLLPVFRVRPRPDRGYAEAAWLAMMGDDKPMRQYVESLIAEQAIYLEGGDEEPLDPGVM